MNPLAYEWTGDSFKVLPRFSREADKRFVIGEVYVLDEIQERSSKTHAHYFASVGQAWVNMPDAVAGKFPTSEHLRKYALIKAGFHNHRSIVAANKTEARRLAAFVKPMDDFAIVTVSECVINVFTAQSQSHRAMGKEQFAKSKSAVLEILADMIGVTDTKLKEAAE